MELWDGETPPELDPKDTPPWVNTGAGILAFVLLTLLTFAGAGLVFLIVVKLGLWLFGV